MQKFAVLTQNPALFQLLNQNLATDTVQCDLFQEDIALSRAIYRDEFLAIFIDFNCLARDSAVLARRKCYADRRAPLIVIGTFRDRASIEMAFAAGADEVVIAPFTGNELAVRTYQALRRFDQPPGSGGGDKVSFGAYALERLSASIRVDGEPARLTAREFAIAWILFEAAGEYVSRRQIAGAVWGSTEDIVGRTLEQHIYKLRKKLRLNGSLGVQLRTLYAHGYRVELGSDQQAPAAMATTVPTMPLHHTSEPDTLLTAIPAQPAPPRERLTESAEAGASTEPIARLGRGGRLGRTRATHPVAAPRRADPPWPLLHPTGSPAVNPLEPGPSTALRLSLPWPTDGRLCSWTKRRRDPGNN